MSDKIKQIIKILAGIICGIILFVVATLGLNYMFVPKDDSWMDHWYRILANSYYEQDHIDNLFVGTSHVHNGVDPFILDDINGEVNFNLSSPGLLWSDAYYMLRQVCSDYDPKHVYLDCYYLNEMNNLVWEDESRSYVPMDPMDMDDRVKGSWLMIDNIKPSLNRFMMRVNISRNGRLIEGFLPFTRYRAYMIDWERSEAIMAYKQSGEYLDEKEFLVITGDGGTETVVYSKGFFSEGVRDFGDVNKVYEVDGKIDSGSYTERSRRYFEKTVEYCVKNGIDVTLINIPIYDLQLISAGDYDAYVSDIRALADKYGIEYYDFNLLKKDQMDLRDEEYYADVSHLNAYGSSVFTPILWDVLSSTADENAEKFYDTYAEKLADQDPKIFGVYYTRDPAAGVKHYTIASNRDDMTYVVARSLSDGDEATDDPVEVVKENGPEKSFDIPVEEHGMLYLYGIGDDYQVELDTIYTQEDEQ
ncbi:MAG: hypothetical protein J5509_03875 [Lachnospiraceae bacterium]|nr:hypothetical protein [Lachnospiraceae bacterium]